MSAIKENIVPLIIALSTLIGTITAFFKIVLPFIAKNKKNKRVGMTWERIEQHPVLTALIERQCYPINDNTIKSFLKRRLVEKCIIHRCKRWFDKINDLIHNRAVVAGVYILNDRNLLAKWFTDIIQETKEEQLRMFPREYIEKFYIEYISKIGVKTYKTIEDIFDNKMYDHDLEKLYAILGVVDATIESLSIINIATANDMNGSLEKILKEREND
jgi:hypothetical protein